MDRIAYLVSAYPATSHTFIAREVRALRALGAQVTTVSVSKPDPPDRLSPEDAAEAATTHVLKGRSVTAWLWLLVRSAVGHPRAVSHGLLFALRTGRGARGTLWQVFYWLEALAAWQVCRREGIRHVHAHFANNGADIARLVAAMGRQEDPGWRWSFTMHGPAELNDVPGFGLAGKAASADFVACISNYARSQLMALTGPEAWPRMRIVRCAVEPAEFADLRPDERQPGPLRLLTVGRVVPVKGHHVLLEALSRCAERGTDVEATIVGDGPLMAVLSARATSLGVDDRVTFTGAVGSDVVKHHLARTDAFVLPSFQEGVPVVLMEAMAAGLPVVSTRITGIPELVTDGVCGLLVPPGDVDALTDALASLAALPDRGASWGRSGQEVVRQEFASLAQAEVLLAAFRATASAPPAVTD